MEKILSETPDYFDKEEIREWTKAWKQIGENITEEEIAEIMKMSKMR